MRIPRYWVKDSQTGNDARGKTWTCSAWGWSFKSVSDARGKAADRAGRMLAHFCSGSRPERYDYLEAPLREEIVETLGNEQEPEALVTRNRYGALVLNAARVCFVDIDAPAAEPGGVLEALLGLFSKSRREVRERRRQEALLRPVEEWAEQNRRAAFRVYATRGGLRLIFTDKLYEPAARETEELFRALRSDPLYVKLTQRQECFRARLTPKPWRIGCPGPPGRYPRPDGRAEQRFQDWLRRYDSKSIGFAVCRLLKEVGRISGEPAISRVVAYHDRCLAGGPSVKLA
ncbi:MAG TPA: hypothetical protein VGB20_03195 [bacterium]